MARLAARAIIILSAVTLAATPAQAGTSSEQKLADRYAPIVVFREQKKACGSGEPYRPIALEGVLGNDEIVLRGADHAAAKTAPTAADLYGKGEGYYLDLPGNPLSPGCTYEREARRWNGDRLPAAYAHVVHETGRDVLALQYWFYYVFNDFNNKHESDWEMIQLLFDAADAKAALQTKPAEVAYSQHEGGERASWDDEKLEREGDRPVVYAAGGSHANYYSSALWLGRGGSEGFGCDDTSGPSTRVSVEAVLVPTTAASSKDPSAWVAYTGRWGQFEHGYNNGPTGPSTKNQWLRPVDWQEHSVRDSSVAVPGVKTLGPSVTGFFCAAVAVGSDALLFAEQKPWVSLGIVLAVLALLTALLRRTSWSPVETAPLRKRRAAGQILRTSRRVYRQHLGLFIGIGAVFLPLGVLFAAIQALLFETWLEGLIDLAGHRSVVSAVLGMDVGGLGILIAAVLVVAATSVALVELERGEKPRVRDCYRTVFSHFRDLFVAVARIAVITILLVLTVVGTPLAINRLVRASFLPQSCVVSGASAKAAWSESSRLVRGTWWRTFGLTATISLTTLLSGLLVGIAFLFLVSSASLYVINVIGSVVFAFAYPYVGIATTLLFFDRVETPAAAAVPVPATS